MLFCALTGELLNARIEEVKQHMKGKKFGRARGEGQVGTDWPSLVLFQLHPGLTHRTVIKLHNIMQR